MKTTTLQNRILTSRIAPIAGLFLAAAHMASAADLTWNGVAGNWDDTTKWSTGVVPGASDRALFSVTTVGVNAFLNGDRFAQGLVFGQLTATGGIRGGTVTGGLLASTLTLGTSGIVTATNTNQVDLGGNGAQAMTIKLAGSQSWTSVAGIATFQSFAAITNAADVAPVTLTIDGASTADRRLLGVVSDGGPTGTVALLHNTPGTVSLANIANTFSGGTTLATAGGTLNIGRAESAAGVGTY